MGWAPGLYVDRDGDLWVFHATGSWVCEISGGETTWLAGPVEWEMARREHGPLVKIDPIPASTS